MGTGSYEDEVAWRSRAQIDGVPRQLRGGLGVALELDVEHHRALLLQRGDQVVRRKPEMKSPERSPWFSMSGCSRDCAVEAGSAGRAK